MCEISIATAAAKRSQSLRWFGAELAATPGLQGFMLKRLGTPKVAARKAANWQYSVESSRYGRLVNEFCFSIFQIIGSRSGGRNNQTGVIPMDSEENRIKSPC